MPQSDLGIFGEHDSSHDYSSGTYSAESKTATDFSGETRRFRLYSPTVTKTRSENSSIDHGWLANFHGHRRGSGQAGVHPEKVAIGNVDRRGLHKILQLF